MAARDEHEKSFFSPHFETRAILNNELLAKATSHFYKDYTNRYVSRSNEKYRQGACLSCAKLFSQHYLCRQSTLQFDDLLKELLISGRQTKNSSTTLNRIAKREDKNVANIAFTHYFSTHYKSASERRIIIFIDIILYLFSFLITFLKSYIPKSNQFHLIINKTMMKST